MQFILLGLLCFTSCNGFITIQNAALHRNPRSTSKEHASRNMSDNEHYPFVKLPKQAEPIHYESVLKIDPFGEVFDGTITIRLLALTNQSHLLLHSRDLVFKKYSIEEETNASKIIQITHVHFDTVHDQVAFNLTSPLSSGRFYNLFIHYTGIFHDRMGMYYFPSCPHPTKEVPVVLPAILTQFECNYARTVFPSFDEPSYKAKWSLTIHHPAEYRARSNGVAEEILAISTNESVTHFAETMLISSYLVAISLEPISNYATKQIEAVTKSKKIKIEYAYPICYDDQVPMDRVAHAAGTVEKFTEYFDIEMNLEKLDVVLGYHAFGGMENSGLITVNRNFGPWESLDEHEISHQWTGNLVTVSDWAEFGIQEGLTEFIEHLPYLYDPKETFGMFRNAFAYPFSLRTSDISKVEKDSPAPPAAYEKGCQLFRLIYAVVGPEAFQRALRTYMKRFAYKSTSWTEHFLPQFVEAWPQSSEHPKFIEFLQDAPTMETAMTLSVDVIEDDDQVTGWIIKTNGNIPGYYEIPILARNLTDSSDRVYWMNTDQKELLIKTNEILFFDVSYFGFYFFEHSTNATKQMFNKATHFRTTDKQELIILRRLFFDQLHAKNSGGNDS